MTALGNECKIAEFDAAENEHPNEYVSSRDQNLIYSLVFMFFAFYPHVTKSNHWQTLRSPVLAISTPTVTAFHIFAILCSCAAVRFCSKVCKLAKQP